MSEWTNKYNPRLIKMYLDGEFWEILDKIVEHNVEKSFVKFLPYLENYVNAVKSNDNNDLVSGTEVCKVLMITRQTLYNWYKNDKLSSLLKNTKIKRGNKNLYKLSLLKKVIDNNGTHFGSGNFYNYKCEALDSGDIKVKPEIEKILTEPTRELTFFEVREKLKSGRVLTESEAKTFRDNEDKILL